MRIFDYTQTYWGHDIPYWDSKDKGQTVHAMGFSSESIQVGDYLRLSNKTNTDGEAHYRVTKIDFSRDPKDMFTADLEFAPRYRCKCGEWDYDLQKMKDTHSCALVPAN